jgi:hypothetical protein
VEKLFNSNKYIDITRILYDTQEKKDLFLERVNAKGLNKKPFETMESLLQYEILEFQKNHRNLKKILGLVFYLLFH